MCQATKGLIRLSESDNQRSAYENTKLLQHERLAGYWSVQRMFWDFLTLSSNDLNLSINSVYYEFVFIGLRDVLMSV